MNNVGDQNEEFYVPANKAGGTSMVDIAGHPFCGDVRMETLRRQHDLFNIEGSLFDIQRI